MGEDDKDDGTLHLPPGFDLANLPTVIRGDPHIIQFGGPPLTKLGHDLLVAKMNHDEEVNRVPHWEWYFGNHHNPFPCEEHLAAVPTYHDLGRFGGGVSFGRRIGKPLSDALWWDIVARIKPHKLLIYRYNAEQWCLGWGSGTLIIYLDENENVSDITWYF